jgi:hypothetical protein
MMKQTDAPLNVLTDGEQPECVELALKYGLTAVRWYRPATTGVKGGG